MLLPSLPILAVADAVSHILATERTCILEAPPGAGKTTVLPLFLLDASWMSASKIVMLEPRRLAAKAAARRMAALSDSAVGQTVGYRMRMDTAVSAATRIEVVTEGILARMLHEDPTLSDVGLVIFDEFHERSIHADLALALCLHIRDLVRDDLRLLVMSATLSNLDALPRVMRTSPSNVVRSEGRMFDVDTQYVPLSSHRPREESVTDAILSALAQTDGDVLVFLPGIAEISRVQRLLTTRTSVEVVPLFGDLSGADQDRAVLPSASGARKVVLSTSIAETSITIEGVRVVIDAGLSREPRFDHRSGMTRLVTVPVARDAADQRRGRAGRTAPGVCMRLWSRAEHEQLKPRKAPEILVADLAPLALELAAWSIADPESLAWIDPPPPTPFNHGRELLTELGALDAGGAITPHGAAIASLGMHPRIAHMSLTLLHDPRLPSALAPVCAALLSERDILRSANDADLRRRVAVLLGATDADADRQSVRMVRERMRMLTQRWKSPSCTTADIDAVGMALALAYPDRIAACIDADNGWYQLRSGRNARLPRTDLLSGEPWLAVGEVEGREGDAIIRCAAPLTIDAIAMLFTEQIQEIDDVRWNETSASVQARRRRTLGALTLDERPLANPSAEQIAHILASVIAEHELRDLPWTRAAEQFREKCLFCLAQHAPFELHDMSTSALCASIDAWLVPHLVGMHRLRDVQSLDLLGILRGMLPWDTVRAIDAFAPTSVTLAKGRVVHVDYTDANRPVLAARLQDLFGMHDTPRIGMNTVPLTVHVLSPAGRPMQVTQDLAGFWKGSYADVRKEMRGRYPKHQWPERPWENV